MLATTGFGSPSWVHWRKWSHWKFTLHHTIFLFIVVIVFLFWGRFRWELLFLSCYADTRNTLGFNTEAFIIGLEHPERSRLKWKWLLEMKETYQKSLSKVMINRSSKWGRNSSSVKKAGFMLKVSMKDDQFSSGGRIRMLKKIEIKSIFVIEKW